MADKLAASLFHNLREKVLKLPDACLVFPAHGAGSLCGKAMGDKRSSTIGYERLFNAALLHGTEKEFKAALLDGMPEAPDHFARCSDINRAGPTPLAQLPDPSPLTPSQARDAIENGHIAVDGREAGAFGGGHIPGAYHVVSGAMFSTFAGWVLPPDKPILLVAESDDHIPALTARLRRVGLDNVSGYLAGGMEAWIFAGLPAAQMPQVSVHELKAMLDGGEPVCIVDVRTQGEWDGGHIEGALHIPFSAARTRYGEIPPDTKVAMVCRTGGRASLGGSILKQHGVRDVAVISGGMTAWNAAGFSAS